MKLTGTIYTTNKDEFVRECLPKIASYILKAKGVTIGDIYIEEIKLDVPPIPILPVIKTDGTRYTNFDWNWIQEKYPANGNFSCLHISRSERDELGLLHNSGKNVLGGRYNRNIGDNSMEFLVIADSVKKFIQIFLHELSHGFSHWSGVADRTHSFEAEGKFIGDHYADFDFTKWNALKQLVDTLTAKKELLEQQEINVMTNPEFLITHHGADARKLTLDEMRRIYQDTHYENLYKKYDQPRSGGQFPDIAYHILIGTDGWAYQRELDIPGYHASNYPVNINSVAICISGNYDRDTLSPEMETFYRKAVADVRKKLPSLKYVNGHRAYAAKSCPGGTITDTFIKEVFDTALDTPDLQKAKLHIANALSNLQQAINEL